jgi:hypothetical protein
LPTWPCSIPYVLQNAAVLGQSANQLLQVDTVAKRLMSNHGKIKDASHLNTVIFKDKSGATVPKRFLSLFPGLGYAAAYKILQRVYKYGGQPFARDILTRNYGREFDSTFGKGNGKAILHATAGRYAYVTTFCEVWSLPEIV